MKHTIGLTGASGMFGKHLINFLLKKKLKIITTSRKPIKYKNKNIDWKRLDLTKIKNEKQLDNLFGNIKALVHAGALVPTNIKQQNKNKINKTNLNPTIRISNWAKKNNVHFVYISGAIVYENKIRKKIKETSKIKNSFFKDYYGESKKDCDNYLKKKIKSGDKVSILRPTSIYGYGLKKDKIILKLIKLSKLNQPIRLVKPFEKINFIHANDVANAVFKTIKKKQYKIFNLGSKMLYSIKDLSKILIKINNSKSKLQIYGNNKKLKYLYKYNVTSNKAKVNLGWISRISINKGLKLIIDKKYEY